MSEPLTAIEPGQCALCRRAEEGAGWARKSWSSWSYDRAPVVWTCNECVPFAERFYRMTKETRERLELEAHQLACDELAAWMVEQGHGPDLSTLDLESFRDVFANYLTLYGRQIRRLFEV